MHLKPLKRLGTLAATAAIALILIACNGSTGPAGTNGTPGTPGTPGTNGTGPVVNVANLTPAEWGGLSLTGSVTSVDLSKGTPVVNFNVTDTNGTPVVGLAWTTKTATAVVPAYSNVALTIAKLVPGVGGTTQWVNYIVTSTPTTTTAAAPSKPTTDSVGTLVDNGSGNYTYTFYRDITKVQAFLDAATYTGNNLRADLGDVTYNPALTHRVAIQIGGNARGTGTNTSDGSTAATAVPILNPANIFYDFIPATGKPVTATDPGRLINNVAACNACHTRLTVHGGSRVDPNYCSVCHTEQRKYGYAEATKVAGGYSGSTNKINGLAVANMPAFIHRLHMGEALTKTGYNYTNILFNDVRYPQDIRNCQTCHTAQPQSTVTDAPPTAPVTTQGDNWKTVPSALACGACHDDVDFTVGHGPSVPPQADDHLCALCHLPADIAIYHTPVWTPVQAGSDQPVVHGGMQSTSYQATNTANLPKGAHRIDFNIKKVAVSATGIPSITFQYLLDGKAVPFKTDTTGEMFDGFVSNAFAAEANGPCLALAMGISQDGIAKPADYNTTKNWSIKSIWNGTALFNGVAVGTFAPEAGSTGYYVINLTGFPLLNSQLPPGQTFGAVGMGIGLGLMTQTDLTKAADAALTSNGTTMDFTFTPSVAGSRPTGGLLIPSRMKFLSVPVVANQAVPGVARRTILKEGGCNSCHGTLGAFTATTGPANFHAVGIGDSAAETSCVFCHNTTGVDGSAWSYDTKTWVHALHAGGKRVNAYTAHSSSGSEFWTIEYPGFLNDCEACHVPGSYDFSNATNAAQVPNMLWDTVAKGTTVATTPSYPTTGFVQVPAGTVPAPWVTGQPKYLAPFIDQTTEYGTNVTITAPTTSGGNWSVVQPTVNTQSGKGSVVVSPLTAACSACHDTQAAISHMTANGGWFYVDRTQVKTSFGGAVTPNGGTLVNNEQCLVCHGPSAAAAIKTVHMNFK